MNKCCNNSIGQEIVLEMVDMQQRAVEGLLEIMRQRNYYGYGFRILKYQPLELEGYTINEKYDSFGERTAIMEPEIEIEIRFFGYETLYLKSSY